MVIDSKIVFVEEITPWGEDKDNLADIALEGLPRPVVRLRGDLETVIASLILDRWRQLFSLHLILITSHSIPT